MVAQLQACLEENNMWLSEVLHLLTHLCSQEFHKALYWVRYYSLFILMMHVSSLQLSENSVLNLYADDMLLYKQIKCSEDYQQLQMDIDKISSWVDHNNLSLNPAKCKTMLLSRKRNLSHPPQLLLNEAPLEQVEAFKYLGVLISSDLSWSRHIDSICAKGKRLIGLLYRRFSTIANVSSERLIEMYKYLVCPHLEYAARVGSSPSQRHKICGECTKIWTKDVFKKVGSRIPRAAPSSSNSYT